MNKLLQPPDGYRKLVTPQREKMYFPEDAFPESCCEGAAPPVEESTMTPEEYKRVWFCQPLGHDQTEGDKSDNT